MHEYAAANPAVLLVKISVPRALAGLSPADEEHLRLGEELAFVQSLLATADGCRSTQMLDDCLVAAFQDCDRAFCAARDLKQTCTELGRSATLAHMRMLLDRPPASAAGSAAVIDADSDCSRQATLIRELPPDWIFATGTVTRGLSETLRCRFQPCEQESPDEVDVRGLYRAICHEDATTRIAMPGYAQTAASKGHSLNLRWRKHTLTLDAYTPELTFGRGEQADIRIDSELASRIHARLGFQETNFILADQSTNGTYVQIDAADEVFLHHEQIVLRGSGVISLGRRVVSGRGKLIYFTVGD